MKPHEIGTPRWELFEHDADIGVRGTGPTIAKAFEMAGMALTSVVTSLEKVSPRECLDIVCQASSPDYLFLEWLNALIFEMDTRKMLFSRFEVHSDLTSLTARVWGESVDLVRHEPAVYVKGATFCALRVEEKPPGSWTAQCVVDV